jgi:cytochrome c biogenesis protein CcmG, thiol:disulfide interchange protein DsbE
VVSESDQAGTAPAPKRQRLRRALQGVSVLVVLTLLGLLVLQLVHSGRGSKLVSAIAQDKKPLAPNFTLPVIWSNSPTWPSSIRTLTAGDKLSLAALRGHPVLLNFWASWCVPCKAEAPLLAAAARTYAGRVVFLGVDVQDFRSAARNFMDRYGVRYAVVQDQNGNSYGDYGLTGIPETYWIDARGRLVGHYPGQLNRSLLARGIEQAERR